MSLSPTYRADWLREDLLAVLELIQDGRVTLARQNLATAEGRRCEVQLSGACARLSRAIAHRDIPDLADLIANAENAP